METKREDMVTSRSHCGAKEGLQEGDSRSTARTTPTAPAQVPRTEHMLGVGQGPGHPPKKAGLGRSGGRSRCRPMPPALTSV